MIRAVDMLSLPRIDGRVNEWFLHLRAGTVLYDAMVRADRYSEIGARYQMPAEIAQVIAEAATIRLADLLRLRDITADPRSYRAA